MQYDLSIVIVNYNVRHFLQQTLESVERAIQDLKVEVWVVDNNSVDDSMHMVREVFPWVKRIENKDNPGFSKANNQAIVQSNAKYVLLLNPDTVLQEDTLIKCFQFMEKHPDAGAVGAKMIDGSGQFLPESKRGFPTPWVSFCKATGLSKIFKNSPTFNQYHLGYLAENETHKIDVLCGAFMFMRKSVLDKIGLLDEAFFMYGEDIDLSYRIKQAGHEIYYYPETQLIHFKGESTKKGSVNYVRVFYQAMIIFAKKHFSGKGAGILVLMLNLAIFGRASISLLKRLVQQFAGQIIDFAGLVLGFIGIKEIWEYSYFKDADYFDSKVIWGFMLYAFVYVLLLILNGVYRERYHVRQVVQGVFTSLLILLAIYALVQESYRFSRALLLLSAVWALIYLVGRRMLARFIKHRDFKIGQDVEKRLFVVGTQEEITDVQQLLDQSLTPYRLVAKIATSRDYDSSTFDTSISNIKELSKLEKIHEIIFCMKELAWDHVMKLMHEIGPNVEYKMVGDNRLTILGSKSKNTSGELYAVQFNYNLARWQDQWKKRAFDIVFAACCLLLFPIFALLPLAIFRTKDSNKSRYFSAIFQVLSGKKSWVSYDASDDKINELPAIKPGIIAAPAPHIQSQEMIHRANIIYAKDYMVWRDIELVFRSSKH